MCKTGKYRLDDLLLDGLKLYQNPEGFCFGTDAVLLANFASKYIKRNSFVFDLCTGSGIIPILIQAKVDVKKIMGIEVLENVCEMAKQSIRYNNLEEKIEILNYNVKDIKKIYYDKADAVTVNPPYMKESGSLQNENEELRIARHEILCDLNDIVKISSKLLRSGGKFFMVHQTNRLDEIIIKLSENNIAVREIKFIYPKASKNSNLVMIYGNKGGGNYTKVLPPLIIYNDDGSYTKETLEYYGGMKLCGK